MKKINLRILSIALISGAILLFTGYSAVKANTYHEYIENKQFLTPMSSFAYSPTPYKTKLENILATKSIDQKTLKTLNSHYSSLLKNYRELLIIDRQIQLDWPFTEEPRGDINDLFFSEHLEAAQSSLTNLESQLNEKEDLVLTENQLMFFQSLLELQKVFEQVGSDFEEISKDEMVDMDEPYWREYLSKLNQESAELVILKL